MIRQANLFGILYQHELAVARGFSKFHNCIMLLVLLSKPLLF